MITLNEIMGKQNVKTVMNDLYKKSYSKRAFIEFQKYYENNKQIIRQEIENNKYQPENIILKEIINYKGKRRFKHKR